MSVSIDEVLCGAGFNIRENVEDAQWLLSQLDEWDQLTEIANDLVEADEYEKLMEESEQGRKGARSAHSHLSKTAWCEFALPNSPNRSLILRRSNILGQDRLFPVNLPNALTGYQTMKNLKKIELTFC